MDLKYFWTKRILGRNFFLLHFLNFLQVYRNAIVKSEFIRNGEPPLQVCRPCSTSVGQGRSWVETWTVSKTSESIQDSFRTISSYFKTIKDFLKTIERLIKIYSRRLQDNFKLSLIKATSKMTSRQPNLFLLFLALLSPILLPFWRSWFIWTS